MSADRPPQPAAASLDGAAALPRANGELVFTAPWEGRAFGMAVALHEGEAYPWDAFRDQLIAEIARAEAAGESSPYYERWLAAFERLLVQRGLLTHAELTTRVADLAARADQDDHQH